MAEFTIMLASFLCVLVISVLIFYIFRRSKSDRYLQIPGPTGLPLFGTFFQIDKMNMHLTLDKWGYDYGEMFCFQTMGQNVLVINSSEIAREIYLHEPMATLTAGRIHTFCSKYIMGDADVIFSTYSNEWCYRRKKAHELLHAYGRGLHEIENQLTIILDNIEQRIKESEKRIVNPSVYINEFLLENLEVMVSGRRGNKDLQESMLEMDYTCNSLSTPGIERILTKFPVIRYLSGYVSDLFKRCLAARSTMLNILQSMQNYSTTSGMYKRLLDVIQEDEKKEKKKMTIEVATYILHDLIAAGYISTHGSLTSILKILISRPQVQTKIQEEIIEVIGVDRHPRIKDRKSCHYTEAVILESLRYISHVPLACHCAIEDFQFRGINIPKGCAIFVNTWHIHHKETEFDDPFQFKPERFLDDEGKLLAATHPQRRRKFEKCVDEVEIEDCSSFEEIKEYGVNVHKTIMLSEQIHLASLMTFGVGKRSCIGEVLAQSNIFLFLAHVMQSYTVYSPTDASIPLFHPTEMKPGLVLHPTDYTCKFISKI